MSKWSIEEVSTLAKLGPTDWEGFHALHPDRPYDSWEVKRRRVPGGSAGRSPAVKRLARRMSSAASDLRALADILDDLSG